MNLIPWLLNECFLMLEFSFFKEKRITLLNCFYVFTIHALIFESKKASGVILDVSKKCEEAETSTWNSTFQRINNFEVRSRLSLQNIFQILFCKQKESRYTHFYKLKLLFCHKIWPLSIQNYEKFIFRVHSKKGTVISIDCKNFWILRVTIEFQIEQFFRDFIFLYRPLLRFPKR